MWQKLRNINNFGLQIYFTQKCRVINITLMEGDPVKSSIVQTLKGFVGEKFGENEFLKLNNYTKKFYQG